MSIYVVTVKHPQNGKPVDWYFDDSNEASRALKLARSEHEHVFIRDDYISGFDEFEAWFKGEA